MNIGKIFGININLHYSWFFILILLAWSLATSFFPIEAVGLSTTTYWILGFLAAVLLFASVLAHELSHSIVAQHHGLKVSSITLFFFGGVASANEKGLNPKKEFQIAIAGPLLSIALGGFFFLLTLVPMSSQILPVISYLFKVNIVLAIFNMIPGFPLDGGRVFRSIAWKITGNLKKATGYASMLGRVFGILMVFWGFFTMFTKSSGLWFILLGGFLYILAKASYDQVLVKEVLTKIKVKQLSKKFTKFDVNENIESFMEDFKPGKLFAVKFRNEFFVLDFEKLGKIQRFNWPVALLKDIMVKVKPLQENWNGFKSLEAMSSQNANMLPVVKNKRIVGVVTLDDLLANFQ